MSFTIARQRMDALFNPRSVAFIGANERSAFSAISYDLVRRFGAVDRTYLINPNSPEVYGVRTYGRCVDVPGGVDCAYVMVPKARVPEAIDDAAASGARSAVVLTAGYRETGTEGAQAQDDLVAQCAAAGITLLGPNVLGFANVAAGIPVCALPGLPRAVGPVALVSQSGAGAGSLTRFVESHGIRFSYAVTTGNEAMVCTEDVIDYLLDDDNTRAVAVFAETFRKPAAFLAVARKAAALRKALVVLKVGSSQLSARTATAHTGALVGDDAVIDAVLRQEGVIRVDHMEDLLHTANVAAHTGPWRRTGVAVASLSGGACDIIADRSEELGLPLPELAPSTQTRLAGIVSDLGHIQNPLDVTGAGVTDPSLLARATQALGADANIGFVAVVGGRPTAVPMPGLGAALASTGTPGAYVATVSSALDTETDAALHDSKLLYLPSIRDAVTALAKVSWWTERLNELATAPHPSNPAPGGCPIAVGSPISELDVRNLLIESSVPVVPADCVTNAQQAGDVAALIGAPTAMKVVSPDIPHKSDVGCVRLGVSPADAAAAYEQIMKNAAAITPRPDVLGVLVAPMRTDGVELIVGVTRDPDWGHVLAVGLGGIFVEVFRDSALLRLPASDADITWALNGLRVAPLLRGARNRPPADLAALTAVIRSIADLAVSLGDDLQTLEINPLYVRGNVIQALDGLVTWMSPGAEPSGPTVGETSTLDLTEVGK
jgi:acyl-CoA synthetase (NDP forming)